VKSTIKCIQMNLHLPERNLRFPRRPLLMGIVNVNDDSFSGDGTLDATEALSQVRRQVEAGADVVDIGAESARTNRAAISVEEECGRLRGVLGKWKEALVEMEPRDSEQVWPPVLSVNTWRPQVIKVALDLGGELINDMSGLPDGENARLTADHGAALLLMHTAGPPKEERTGQQWADIMGELERFFGEKMELAESAGLSADHVLLDPGIDFAKQRADNLLLIRELERLHQFNRPILLPISRKTVIGEVLGIEDPDRQLDQPAAELSQSLTCSTCEFWNYQWVCNAIRLRRLCCGKGL